MITRIRSTVGAVLRRRGNSLDSDGAFRDEVAVDVRRRLASDLLKGRIPTGSVTCGGGGGIKSIISHGGSGASVSIDPLLFDPRGGGDGGPMPGYVGPVTMTGPGWEVIEVDIDSGWSTGTPKPHDGTHE